MHIVGSRRAIAPIVAITVLGVAWLTTRTEPIESAGRVGFKAPHGSDPTPEIVALEGVEGNRGIEIVASEGVEGDRGIEIVASEGVEGDRGVEIVSYDAAADRVSLWAHNVSVATVLEALEAATGIEIVALDPALLAGSISIELDGVSLTEALHALLGGLNKIVTYRAEGADGDLRITRVLIAKNIEGGGEAEKQRAAESVLESVEQRDASAYALSIAALGELPPGPAVEELSKELVSNLVPGDGDSGAGSLNDDASKAIVQRQITVADALGDTGSPDAVDPLIVAFHQPDGGVRQIAADGLAALGNSAGEAFLLQAVKDPRLEWRRPAALAIVLQGSPEAKAALAEQISQGSVPMDGIPQVALALFGEQ